MRQGMQSLLDLLRGRLTQRSFGDADFAALLQISDKFDEAIADFSIAYADQSERDHKILTTAVREGRLGVVREGTTNG